jgi:hypothetical protein
MFHSLVYVILVEMAVAVVAVGGGDGGAIGREWRV